MKFLPYLYYRQSNRFHKNQGSKQSKVLESHFKLCKALDGIKIQNVSQWQWIVKEYALLILSSQVSLSPSLSLSLSLWCLWGSERIWVECFSGRWTKSVHNKKLFLNRKLMIQLLTFILLECFPAYLQAFRYLMSQILPFTPCGFYNAYL